MGSWPTYSATFVADVGGVIDDYYSSITSSTGDFLDGLE